MSFKNNTAKEKDKRTKKLFKIILKKFPNHNPNKPLPISLSEIAKLDIQSPFGERATLYYLQRLIRAGKIISPKLEKNNNYKVIYKSTETPPLQKEKSSNDSNHKKPLKRKLNYEILEDRVRNKELEKRVERIKERFSIKYY